MSGCLDSDMVDQSTGEPKHKSVSELSRLARMAVFKENKIRALEQLDKMVEDISVKDLPGMCSFSYQSPVFSRSDGQIFTEHKTR